MMYTRETMIKYSLLDQLFTTDLSIISTQWELLDCIDMRLQRDIKERLEELANK
jgi:hypothetical protein